MDDGVELSRNVGHEVMAESLGLGSVNDSDGSLEPLNRQRRNLERLVHAQAKARDPGSMEQRLVAFWQGWPHLLALRWLIPVRRRGDRARVRRKADGYRLPSGAFAHQLADV